MLYEKSSIPIEPGREENMSEQEKSKRESWTGKIVRKWRSSSRIELGVWVVCGLGLIMLVALISATIRDALLGAPLAPSKDLMAPVVAATGVIIAVMAFARDRGKIERDRAEARSKIVYEQAKQGLESVYALLKDQNNERAVWLRAARLLSISLKLGNSIQSEEYRLAHELVEEDIRARLYEALTLKGSGKARDGLPPQFFFGEPQWKVMRNLPLSYLAVRTAPKSQVTAVTQEENVPHIALHNLQEASVKIIMDFLQFPSDYQDPLEGVNWTQLDGWSATHGPAQGARRYLQWKAENYVLGEKAIRRERPLTGEQLR